MKYIAKIIYCFCIPLIFGCSSNVVFKDKSEEYCIKGHFESAIENYNKAIKLHPDNYLLLIDRGNVWFRMRRLDKALEDYDKAIIINPNFTDAYIKRANLFKMRGDFDEAIFNYSKAIELDPKSVSTLINRGHTWILKNDFDNAISDCNKAIKINDRYSEAYLFRAIALGKKKDFERAIKDINRAIELSPKNVDCYLAKGDLLYQSHDSEGAIENYTIYLNTEPKSNVFLQRGNAFKRKGEFDKAISDFYKAIRIDPNFTDAYNNLVWIFVTCKDKKYRNGAEGIALAKKALSINETPSLLDSLAASYAEVGMFEEAVSTQKKALLMIGCFNEQDSKKCKGLKNHLNYYLLEKPWRE